MSKRRRAEPSGQATSPKLGPKTRTRVHALQQPARRRTAPLVLALRPQPRILPSSPASCLGLVTSRSLLLSDSCVAATRQPRMAGHRRRDGHVHSVREEHRRIMAQQGGPIRGAWVSVVEERRRKMVGGGKDRVKSRETLRRMGEGGVRIVRWWCERGRITGCGDGSHFSVHERAPDRSCLALPNNQKIKKKIPYQYHFFYHNPQKNQKSGKYHSNTGK